MQLETLAEVLTRFEAAIEQGDERLQPRDVPEDLNPTGRLRWVENELDYLAPRLNALRGYISALLKRLDLTCPHHVPTQSKPETKAVSSNTVLNG